MGETGPKQTALRSGGRNLDDPALVEWVDLVLPHRVLPAHMHFCDPLRVRLGQVSGLGASP